MIETDGFFFSPKRHRGRDPHSQVRLFGMVGTTPLFVVYMGLWIIEEPIFSCQWSRRRYGLEYFISLTRGYLSVGIRGLGFVHRIVNHSLYFVDRSEDRKSILSNSLDALYVGYSPKDHCWVEYSSCHSTLMSLHYCHLVIRNLMLLMLICLITGPQVNRIPWSTWRKGLPSRSECLIITLKLLQNWVLRSKC